VFIIKQGPWQKEVILIILEDPKKDKKKLIPGWPAVIFGVLVLSVIAYCLATSNHECLRYFSKGIKEDCSEQKINGIGASCILALFGLIFLAAGITGLRSKNETSKNNDST